MFEYLVCSLTNVSSLNSTQSSLAQYLSPRAEALFAKAETLLKILPMPVESAKKAADKAGGRESFQPSLRGPASDERRKEILRDALYRCRLQVEALNEDFQQ